MAAPSKRKLCWNCEGMVSLEEENCPYCGVYLNTSNDDAGDEGIYDLFSPPYSMEEEANGAVDEPTPPPPYSMAIESDIEEVFGSSHVHEEIKSSAGEVKRIIVPLTLLLSGTVFFLFGLALFLFSRQGVFILQWNGAYWYLYLAFGLMGLVVGWKALGQVEESD